MMDTTKKQTLSYSQFHIEVPFLDHLNIMVEPLDNSPKLLVDLDRIHMNGGWNAHGGLIMTLLDMSMAATARLTDPMRRGAVTVEMKTNFMKPGGKIGGKLFAQGAVRHSSKKLSFCDAEIKNENGELIATASGTFKFITNPINKTEPIK